METLKDKSGEKVATVPEGLGDQSDGLFPRPKSNTELCRLHPCSQSRSEAESGGFCPQRSGDSYLVFYPKEKVRTSIHKFQGTQLSL